MRCEMSIDALIISAGYSSRMNSFKPLMKFQGIPFLFSIILKISNVCQKIFIITGYRDEDLREEITKYLLKEPEKFWLDNANIPTEDWNTLSQKISFHKNPSYHKGMFSSLQCGLNFTEAPWILYHFVDQPHIPKFFYEQFVAQISSDYDWIQPRYRSRSAHPILLNRKVIKSILNSDSFTTLKDLTKKQKFRKKLWDCNFPEVIEDFNTENDITQSGEIDEFI